MHLALQNRAKERPAGWVTVVSLLRHGMWQTCLSSCLALRRLFTAPNLEQAYLSGLLCYQGPEQALSCGNLQGIKESRLPLNPSRASTVLATARCLTEAD